MRNIDWLNIEASGEGSFDRLEPGAYVGTITAMTDEESKQYVRMLFDIAEGKRKGFFADDFYKDKPWAHQMILSYRDKALPMLKGRMETINRCNPGFDAMAAFDANLSLFVGKRVGLVMREEEYFDKKTETFKMGSARCFRLCSIEDVASGKYANVKPKTLSAEERKAELKRLGYSEYDAVKILMAQAGEQVAEAAAKTSAEVYDDIPFD